MNRMNLIAAALLTVASAGAFAQTTASTVQRDVNQQQRIEAGLKDGSLSTKEAARLEREQSQVDKLQARSLKDGNLSAAEQAKLRAAQDRTSADINAARHNDVTGNPQSASSKRMQADVQRDVNQQQRIEQGVQSGSLTNREVAKLERGEGRIAKREAVAGRDGHVGAAEQRGIQRQENRQSKRIRHEKHDAQAKQG